MSALFIKLLNMSIAASWVILAAVVLRLLLKKVRWLSCLLWAVAAIRLVCPFTIESVFSLIPSGETVSPDIVYATVPAINSGVTVINSAVNPVIGQAFMPSVGDSANPLQIWSEIASYVWIAGLCAMLVYTAVSYILLRRKVSASIPLRDNLRICDEIRTPFILGIFRPRIYLPSDMSETQTGYVITHENAHLRRRDHLWKPLGFALLAVYWFSPLCWLAYVLFCRDIEFACDEKVIRDLGAEDKKTYSEALLSCSVSRRMIAACPLAFGEAGVKKRIKSVLSYKKPAFWIIITAVAVCTVLAVCFLTDPQSDENTLPKDHSYREGLYLSCVNDADVIVADDYGPMDMTPENDSITFNGLTAGDKIRIEVYLIEETYPAHAVIYSLEKLSDGEYEDIDPAILQSLKELGRLSSGVTIYENLGMKVPLPDSYTGKVSVLSPDEINEENRDRTIIELYQTASYNKSTGTDKLGWMYSIMRVPESEIVPDEYNTGSNYYFAKDANRYYMLMRPTSVECDMSDKAVADEYAALCDEADTVMESFIKANHLEPYHIQAAPRLTLDDVITLSQKGGELTWTDFEKYSCIETGSGLYIRIYNIDEQFYVMIGGGSTDEKPMYIYLMADPNGDNRIDIRTDDVKAFIEKCIGAVTSAETAEQSGQSEQTIALSETSALQFIKQTLGTLKLYSDNTVSFTVPQIIPAGEETTRLTISLNANFTESAGVYATQNLLDWKTGWNDGEVYTGSIDTDKGKLTELTLRVAFMTEVQPNAFQEYAANYVTLTAPFEYGVNPVVNKGSVSIETRDKTTKLLYTLQNGEQASISISLPDGMTLVSTENYPDHQVQQYDAMPPSLVALKNNVPIGTLRLYDLATTDIDTLKTVDTQMNELPMAIFATIALSNHAGYDDYTVMNSYECGANATALYVWQDLNGVLPAAKLPWHQADCVLAYDWSVMPYFMELILDDGVYSESVLAEISGSIKIDAVI